MRSKFALATVVACSLAFGSTVSRAEKPAGKSQKELVPESINRQFAWEEKVVGPKDGVDHAKIAALQSQARKDAELQKNQPPPKKAERAEGVAAPASVVLPTMDIEKPAPAGSIRRPTKKVVVEQKPQADAIDALLASNRTSDPVASSNERGLKKVLASNSKAPRNKKARVKRGHRRSSRMN